MAIMGRKKQMVKRVWDMKNKDFNEKIELERENIKKKEVAEEEHLKRVEMLKKIGLLKK